MTDPKGSWADSALSLSADTATGIVGGSVARQIAVAIIAVLLGLVVGAILIIISGLLGPEHVFDLTLPFQAYGAMLEGALGRTQADRQHAECGDAARSSPAWRSPSGSGPACSTSAPTASSWSARSARPSFGTIAGIPFPVAMLLSMVVGALGGAAWGFIPGALKAWRGAHEVVTTIMLNSIAYLLLNLLASQVFADPTATFPRTPDIQPGAQLPIILADTRLHLASWWPSDGARRVVRPVQDDARVRDPDGRCERQCRPLRRHPTGASSSS